MNENCMFLDWSNIEKYTRDHREYLFVDTARVIPGQNAESVKLVSGQDWYFRIHFPNDPIMPGVFVMEAIMTTGAFTLYTMDEHSDSKFIFHSANNVRMYGEVRPGSILKCFSRLLEYRRGVARLTGEAAISENKVCSMEFSLVEPNIIRRIIGDK